MFTEIRNITNIGSFKDFKPNPYIRLEKNNIFYALNGHGKTTLTAILNSIKNNDNNSIHGRKTLGENGELECIMKKGSNIYKIDNKKWTKNGLELDEINKEIIIFDDNYINNNLFTEKFEKEHKRSLHKIIFGEKGVLLNNDLNTVKKEKDEDNRKLDIILKKFSLSQYEILDYINIDISKLIKNDLEKEKEILIKNIHNIKEQAKIKLKEKLIKLPKFDYILSEINDKFTNLKINGEAHKKAKIKVEEFKKSNFNNSYNSDTFLKYGLENIKDNKCSFCHQDLGSKIDLIEIYKDFFDDEYEKVLKSLQDYYKTYKDYNFEADIIKLKADYKSNLDNFTKWKEIIIKLDDLRSLKDINDFINNVKDNNKIVLDNLEEKGKDLNSDFKNSNLVKIIKSINSANEIIEQYNVIIDTINNTIDTFKSGLYASKLAILEKQLKENNKKILRLDKDEIKKVEDYYSIKKIIKLKEDKIIKKREELNIYTNTIIVDYEKIINDKLKILGISNFELSHIKDTTHVNGSFVEILIKINNKEISLKDYDDSKPTFKNTLSRGDKNSLAFAFFLAFLENNTNKENLILIFDDPLSSHDENRQIKTSYQMKLLSALVKQIIILTHKKDFFNILNKDFLNNNCLYFNIIKSRSLGESKIIKINNIKEFLNTEFNKTILRLEKYLDDITTATIGNLQNDIRKVFEDILILKYYRILRDNKYKTIFTYNTLNTYFYSELLLLDIKDELNELMKFVNDGSHFTSISGNEEDLCSYIEQTFKLIHKI